MTSCSSTGPCTQTDLALVHVTLPHTLSDCVLAMHIGTFFLMNIEVVFFSSRFLFSAGGPAALTIGSYCVFVALRVFIDHSESPGVMFGRRMMLPTRFASVLRSLAQLLPQSRLLCSKLNTVPYGSGQMCIFSKS